MGIKTADMKKRIQNNKNFENNCGGNLIKRGPPRSWTNDDLDENIRESASHPEN